MCDTFVVVRPEGVLFAKNSDRDPNEAQRIEWHPAREHAPDATVRCTWRTIPQARRTRATTLSRPFWMWGAEMGTNDAGLCVGNEAVFVRGGSARDGLTGMDLVRLVLERAGSVDEGVEVLRALLQTHGQGGRCGYDSASFRYDNSFLLADATGAAVVETAGRELAAERVTSGARAISNGLSIEPFATRHADRLRTHVARAAVRRERVTCLAANATTPADAAAVLRDHGPGRHGPGAHGPGGHGPGGHGARGHGLHDATTPGGAAAPRTALRDARYSWISGAMGAPCMHAGGWIAASQTVGSWISWLTPASQRHWATGSAAPCLSVFHPLPGPDPACSLDAAAAQALLGTPDGAPDPTSWWWAVERLHRSALTSPNTLPSSFHAERDELEARLGTIASDPVEHGRFDEHHAAARAWLARWTTWLDQQPAHDERPRWLRARWARWQRQAARGSRFLPWDDQRGVTATRP